MYNYIYYRYWKCLIQAVSPELNQSLAQADFEIIDKGGLLMTFELVVAVITCIATIICTVIAVLSYFRNKR